MATLKQHKHLFSFRLELPDGTFHNFSHKAVVKTPVKAVRVPLKAAYAEKALDNHGCGNTQLCAVSTAIANNAHLFPHKVLGIVDFHSRTAFVASKRKKDGTITECYRYLHSDDIADRNDTPGELKKLIADLKANGQMYVTLRPRLRNDRTKKGGTGKRDGSRSSQSMGGGFLGAKRRYAVAQMGRYPGVSAV
jgi:hypothetical protein